MELIIQILQYGKNNPTVSLCVVAIFLFIYSVVILRKRRFVKDKFDVDIKALEDKVKAEKEYIDNTTTRRSAYLLRTAESAPALAEMRKASRIIDSYNHMLLAGLAWAVPVYFLWAPIAVLTVPVGLAMACVYPDKIRNLMAKSVDTTTATK